MGEPQTFVKLSEEKLIPKADILSLLRTYNCYHEGKNFQLRTREEDGELVLEGLLNIYWGLRRPIRLQMHDDNERFRLNRNDTFAVTLSASNNNSLDRETEPAVPSPGGAMGCQEEDESPQLLRTRSDASFMRVQRRPKTHTARDLQRLRTQRFSINGHFYNHKTSVFTPAYGSVTNVRVNSSMTTRQVLNLLLHKFRVENKSEEFVLYMVHESGERTCLREGEYPLVARVLYGPCEKISKLFITETDLGEEVTYDVAQYIKFEIPVLDSFVEKLKEEEEREINKLTKKYSALKSMILHQLEDKGHASDMV
ncbi:ras association domain-containing protein 4a isoform X2 [Cynoglossus semilaevis]|nr:ras association domain-containing protein 4 isoform X2 [Cynoglossus semilaevis]XP_024916594.1 ras association domain-containing protein 4 isoform X2 [Cynoglossus semilaevis]XP_024916595.1 ras association domain-containing protein 4 isoform X2 [Cynoglossus semilaevis]XP_024916596.1 ras association domain-containing protein 4 isoform X2 [Cynoglossus semilaevis]XP_024916597.1 ras association domain-containing protein 4 isoform X2 [Cynoglossus semilaevis]XP_024916598.1 ras association domain-co